MSDLDLWLPPKALLPAQKALQRELGYTEMPRSSWWERHAATWNHLPPLVHSGAGVRLELHREVFPAPWQTLLPSTELAGQSEALTWNGACLRRPSPSHRVWHNLGHTLLTNGSFAHGRLELRQLYEWVLLCQEQEMAIDWSALRGRLARQKLSPLLGAYLLSARAIFGQALPAGVWPGPRARIETQVLIGGLQTPPPGWIGRWRFLLHWGGRARRLPQRLLKPSWYAMKYRALRNGASI